jgi:DUF4097 and DUF4098 domain-containing protein YvlB
VFSDLAIEQETGSVRLRNIQGNVKIAIADGSIDTNATAGTLDLSAGGDITVRRSFGPINARCEGGKTLIDSPNSGVIAHTKGGDVRVIAVDGVKGDYDISTENGNISIAVPDTEDVAFWLDVYEGTYRSSVPLTGTSQNDNHTFQGRLNAGTRRILLKAHNGTIMID